MKKLMTVLATALVALTLVGCTALGDAKTSGTKWTKTFKLDATGELKDAAGNKADFSRGFASLSTSKKCSAIETVVTVPVTDAKKNVLSIPTSTAGKNAVVGLAFDVHLTKITKENATKDLPEGTEVYDFVLVGVKPADGFFYIEKYVNVKKENLKESMITKADTIGGTYTPLAPETSGWASKSPIKTIDPNTFATEGYSWKIGVTQETAGTYVIKLNGTEYAKYTRPLTDAEKASKDGKAYGQVFLYGNAPEGTKFQAKFASNKDATVGLFADEEEF